MKTQVSDDRQPACAGNLTEIGERVHQTVDRKMAKLQDKFLGCGRGSAEMSPHGATPASARLDFQAILRRSCHKALGMNIGDIDNPFSGEWNGERRAGETGGELVAEAVLDTYVTRMKQEVLGELREDIRNLSAITEALHEELRQMRERQEQATCFGCLRWLFSGCRSSFKAARDDSFRLSPKARSASMMSLMPDVPDEYDFDTAGTPKHFQHLHSFRNGASSLLRKTSTQRSMRSLSEFGIQPAAVLVEKLYVTGPFSSWKLDHNDGQLQLAARHAPAGSSPPPREGIMRLRLCVQLSSMSFSFQVVNPAKKWTWHLYPRDAVLKVWGLHVSKEGRLWPDSPDAVAVGLGDLKAGHQKNFHVMEPPGTVVTIWVEVPVTSAVGGDGMTVDYNTALGCRVWYTLEDTGVNCVGGDGIDLNKWKRFQAMFE